MDKFTTFSTINSMLGKKHNRILSYSEEARVMICKFGTEQMHQIMLELYKMQNSSDEFVKQSIAKVVGETTRIIGFGVSRG